MGTQDSVKPTQPPGPPESPWPSPQHGKRPSPVVSTLKERLSPTFHALILGEALEFGLWHQGQLCSVGSAGAAGGLAARVGGGKAHPIHLPASRQHRRESRHNASIFCLRCHRASEMGWHTWAPLHHVPTPAYRVARVYSFIGQLLQYLLGTCYVPGTALGASDIMVKKTDTGAAFVSFTC